MTIQECIEEVDGLVINQYEDYLKIKWLNEVDATVYEDVIKQHEKENEVEFKEYDIDTDMSTELLMPAPYSDAYIQYLIAKINYYNGELDKYNNAAAMYNNKVAEYKAWYNRQHMPVQKKDIRMP